MFTNTPFEKPRIYFETHASPHPMMQFRDRSCPPVNAQFARKCPFLEIRFNNLLPVGWFAGTHAYCFSKVDKILSPDLTIKRPSFWIQKCS